MRKKLLFLFLITGLCSCLSTKKDSNGLYDYSYCIRYITPSSVKIKKREMVSDSVAILRGTVFGNENSNFSQIDSITTGIYLLVYQEETNKMISSTTVGNDGKFILKVPKGKYRLSISGLGFIQFQYLIELHNEMVDMEVYVGIVSNIMYGVKSKTKLMRWQIRHRAYQQHKADKKRENIF